MWGKTRPWRGVALPEAMGSHMCQYIRYNFVLYASCRLSRRVTDSVEAGPSFINLASCNVREERERTLHGASFAWRRSSLRHAGLAHGFDDLLASLQENRVVALSPVAITADREFGIELKTGPHFGLRLFVSAKLL
jgi:hypothetical protein